MPLDLKGIGESVTIGVISAVVLGGLGLIWNATTNGGLVRLLGGVAEKDVRQNIHTTILDMINDGTIQVIKGQDGASPSVEAVANELVTKYKEELRGLRGDPAAFPIGAVVASIFDCNKLGQGWTTFREGTGRFLVGAGEDTHRAYQMWNKQLENGVSPTPLSAYKLLVSGGEETHTLTIPEIPRHRHPVYPHAGVNFSQEEAEINTDPFEGAGGGDVLSKVQKGVSGKVGGGEAHNNIPPFIAINYCTKED